MTILTSIWDYNIQIIPVIISLLIFYVPTWLRKISQIYYSPIYFSLAPLRFLNSHIDKYYFQDRDIPGYRKQIIKTAYISVLIDAVLIPIIVGTLLALILNKQIFDQFVLALIAFLSIRLFMSLINFSREEYSTFKTFFFLFLVYLLYLFVVVDFVNMSYYWAKSFVLEGLYIELLLEIKNILLRKILLPIIILGIFVNVFSGFLTKAFDEKDNV